RQRAFWHGTGLHDKAPPYEDMVDAGEGQKGWPCRETSARTLLLDIAQPAAQSAIDASERDCIQVTTDDQVRVGKPVFQPVDPQQCFQLGVSVASSDAQVRVKDI